MTSVFGIIPSYERSQAIDSLQPETGPVYFLNVVYDSQSILHLFNLDNKHMKVSITIELDGPPLWSSILYVLDRRNPRSKPPQSTVLGTKMVWITYESKDLEKLVSLRDRLYFKNMKPNGMSNGCRMIFRPPSRLRVVDGKEMIMFQIKVNTFFAFHDRSFTCFHYVSPKEYRYSMEVKYNRDYTDVGLLCSSPTVYTRCRLQPESTTIRDDGKVVEYQRLVLTGCNEFLTVIYRSPSIENLNQIKKMLTDPCYRRATDSSSYGKVDLFMHTFRDAYDVGRNQFTFEAKKVCIDAQHMKWRSNTFFLFT